MKIFQFVKRFAPVILLSIAVVTLASVGYGTWVFNNTVSTKADAQLMATMSVSMILLKTIILPLI